MRPPYICPGAQIVPKRRMTASPRNLGFPVHTHAPATLRASLRVPCFPAALSGINPSYVRVRASHGSDSLLPPRPRLQPRERGGAERHASGLPTKDRAPAVDGRHLASPLELFTHPTPLPIGGAPFPQKVRARLRGYRRRDPPPCPTPTADKPAPAPRRGTAVAAGARFRPCACVPAYRRRGAARRRVRSQSCARPPHSTSQSHSKPGERPPQA